MSATTDDPAYVTALHEAAHAVVGLHFGHPVRWARVGSTPYADRQGRDALGECDGLSLSDIADESPGRARRLAREVAIVTYAGMVAERDLGGVPVDPMDTYEDAKVETIMEHARIGPRGGYVGDDGWQGYKRALMREAEGIVGRYRDAIRALAAALAERGELTVAEIRAIAGLPPEAAG